MISQSFHNMVKKRIAPEFFKNTIYNFSSFGINHLGGLIFTILIARILDPDAFGMYSLALAIVVILMTIGDLGLNEALIKYVASNFENKSKAKSYIFYLFKVKVLVLFSLSVILMISSKLIAYFYDKPQLAYLLVIGSLYLFFYSVMQFTSSLFYAFKNIRADVYKESIFQASRIALVPLLLIFSFGYLAAGPIVIATLGSIITLAFIMFYLLRKYPDIFHSEKTSINKKEIFHFIKYLSLSSLSIIFLVNTDIIILGKFVTLNFVGFYRAASSAIIIFASLLSLTAVLYPIFSQLHRMKIKKIFDILLYYLFLFAIPITFGVFMFSKQIMGVLFGSSYLPGAFILLGLSLLIIVLPLGELFRALLNSRGKSKITGKVVFYASVLNIVLSIFFVYLSLLFFENPIYAAFGVGVATVISRVFILFRLAGISKKDYHIKINYSFIKKPIIASCIMLIFLFLMLNFVYSGLNIVFILLEVTAAMMVYLISLYLIKGVSKKEINYILQIFKDMKKEKLTKKG